MENFWPKLETSQILDPSNLLKEQGAFLEKVSDGILTFEINKKIFEHKNLPSKKALRLDFYIHAPLIDDYKFLLLYVVHDFIRTYPLHVGFFEEGTLLLSEMKIASNNEEYEKIVKDLLGSNSTKVIIENLYARSSSVSKD